MTDRQPDPPPDPQPDPAGSESAQSRMDRLCDEFERRLKRGERPAIEDFLQKVPQAERAALFPHLLGLEFDYREHAGEELSAADYFARHPEYRAEIERLFRQFEAHERPTERPADRPADRPPGDTQDSGRSSTGLASGPTQMGKYRLVHQCGRGGMGIVYKARHPLLRRPRAVKVLRDHYDTEAAERFRLELENAEVLVHPNIVLVHDAGEDAGRLFMVMEYVDGLDLQRITKERGPLPVGAACEVIRQAALGLQHADEHFLVHRDIKPSNLMLDSAGHVKILDFGLARFRAEREDASSRLTTRDGALLGTVDFMAPEQWRSAGSVTIHADLYSLGCTLYYLLTGEVPYPNTTRTESVLDTLVYKQRAHQEYPIPRLAERCKDCPPELQDVLDRLMAKHPGDRPASPADVVRLMEPFADPQALRPLIPAPTPGDSQITPRTGPPAGSHDVIPKDAAVDPSSVDTNSHGATAVLPKPQVSQAINPRSPDRRVVVLTGLLSLVVALAVLIWRPWRTDPAPSPSTDPAAAAELAQEIASLPGLNGGWWFDETPWLTPAVRAELHRRILADEETIGGIPLTRLGDALDEPAFPADPAMLKALVQRIVEERARSGGLSLADASDARALLLFSEERRKLELVDVAARLRSILPREIPQPEKLEDFEAAEMFGDWSIERLHLLAVLLSALSETDARYGGLADDIYNRTEQAYARHDGSAPLEPLFHADLGRFRAAQNQFYPADIAFGRAAAVSESLLLDLSVAAQRADMLRLWGSMEEAQKALDDARHVAEKAELPPHYPLHLELVERGGWLDLDRWRLGDAQQKFQVAGDAREKQLKDGNPFAYEPWAFDRQGQAMALHFLGRDREAVALYRRQIDDILDFGRSNAPEGLQRLRRDRLPNLYERLADCHLFGPEPDYEQAAQELGEAISHAKAQRFDYSSTRWFHIVRLYHKRAIALLRGGIAEAGQSPQDLLDQAEDIKPFGARASDDADAASATANNAEEPTQSSGARYYMYEERVAEALLADEATRADQLQTMLLDLEKVKVDRRTLEIVLLAFQVYLQSDPAPGRELDDVVHQLIRMTEDVQKADSAMRRAFLLPVYELAQQRLGAADGSGSGFTGDLLRQLAALIAPLRLNPPES